MIFIKQKMIRIKMSLSTDYLKRDKSKKLLFF